MCVSRASFKTSRNACSDSDATWSEEFNPEDYAVPEDNEEEPDDQADDAAGGRPFRWPRRCRIIMATTLFTALTDDEVETLDAGGRWPQARPHIFHATYVKIHEAIIRRLEVERGVEPGQLPEEEKPSYQSVKRAAKRWTLRQIQTGNVNDRPPHVVGYKNEKHRPILAAIRELILEGCKDEEGNTCLYRDIDHLRQANSQQFEPLFQQTGWKTTRTLWRVMKVQYPLMKKVSIRAKREREAGSVQVLHLMIWASTNMAAR